MPRANRHFNPDSIYHVTGRGVERRAIFVTAEDRQFFLMRLLEALRGSACGLLAYCLMGNHFHLLVGVANTPLGQPLHDALTSYSLRFNAINERVGHLFQSRFASRLVHDESYLQNVVAYIHENPVRAGLVGRAEDWEWSSHRDWVAHAGATIDFKRLEELTTMPFSELQDRYLRRLRGANERELKGMPLEQIIFDTATMLGVDPEGIRSGQRGALFTRARGIIIAKALAGGHSVRDLAAALNCTQAAILMAQMRRRCQEQG